MNLLGIIGIIGEILFLTIPVLIGLAVIFFLYGLAKYMLAQDNTEGRQAARSIMLWGVVGLFVMLSIWGLVSILDASFDLDDTDNDPVQLPTNF